MGEFMDDADFELHPFGFDIESLYDDEDFECEASDAVHQSIQWGESNGAVHNSILDSIREWEYAEHRCRMRMQKIVRRRGVKSALLRLIEQILALDPLPRLVYGEINPLYGLIHSPYTQPLLAIRTAKRWRTWHEREFKRCNTENDFQSAALHKMRVVQFRTMLAQSRMTVATSNIESKLLRGSGKMSPAALIVGAQKSDFGRVVHNVGSSESKGGFKKQRIRHTRQR